MKQISKIKSKKKMKIGLFLMVAILISISSCKSLNLQRNRQTQSYQHRIFQPDSIQSLSNNKPPNQRLLAITTETSKPNYVISTWIKKYSSRNQICHYLCQSDSFFAFTSITSCYVTYKCTSIIWQDLIFWGSVLVYMILPIVMIALEIWNFGCWSKYFAIITGIVFVNMIYEKLARDFQQDMETDYDISNSDIESDFKETLSQGQD